MTTYEPEEASNLDGIAQSAYLIALRATAIEEIEYTDCRPFFRGGKRMAASFGDLVKKHLEATNWTQQRLARAVNRDPSTIGRLLSGRTPDAVTLAQNIIDVLDDQLSLTWAEIAELAEAFVLTLEQRQEKVTDQTVIGVILPSLETSHYWGQLVSAIDKWAVPQGGNLVVAQHNNQFDHFMRDLTSFQLNESISGIVCVPPYGESWIVRRDIHRIQEHIDKIRRRGVPVVFVERYPMQSLASAGQPSRVIDNVPYVGPDRTRMVDLAVQHFRSRGHTQIGALIDLPWVSAEIEFLTAFKKAMGVDFREEWIKTGNLVHPESQHDRRDSRNRYQNAIALLNPSSGQRPTAVFCSTHLITKAALDAAAHLDLNVPHDVAIIGVDPTDYLDILEPPTTRIGYNVRSYAKVACDRMWQLKDEKPDKSASRKKTSASPNEILYDDIRLIRPELVPPPVDRIK